jgi:hypothetical protein
MTTDSVSSVPVNVEYPVGTFLTSVDVVPGNDITIVSLPNEASLEWDTTKFVNANSVRVYSTEKEDFVVYMVNRVEFSSDAALALPVDALNTKYIVLDYSGTEPEFVVTAVFDDTTVTINPIHALQSLGGSQAGVPFSVALNRGESYYAIGSVEGSSGLSGTVIEANYPVTLTNGLRCSFIPAGIQACDHIFEVAQPVQSWGTSFAAAPLPQRGRGTVYRIIASEDDTSVTIVNEDVVFPADLSAGETYDSPRSSAGSLLRVTNPLSLVSI